MSGIFGGLENIFTKIVDVPQVVFNLFKAVLENIKNNTDKIWDSLLDVPSVVWNLFTVVLNDIKENASGIWDALLDVPSVVWNLFKAAVDKTNDVLDNIYGFLFDIPELILSGIRAIFIPDPEEIEVIFDNALSGIRDKFGLQEFHLDSLANSSIQPDDIEESYNIHGIGTVKSKFFDTTYLIKGVEYFRPFIRGFIVLLLVFYNFKMFLGFIGHDLGNVAGMANEKGSE